ncbi:MAG: phage holin family protein [Acidobacteriota bacterium]
MFGWAVLALFGQTTPRERTVLSIVVGAAAAWPILLLGVIAPKVAALLVAFVPLTESVSSGTVRLIWIALALLVPVLVGTVFARRSPSHDPAHGRLAFLRGFQITFALAGAFFFVLVAAPIGKITSMARGLMDEYIPLIAGPGEEEDAARKIQSVLREHGYALERARPNWVMKAPGAILRVLGGGAFRHSVSQLMNLFRARDLEVMLKPYGVTLRGKQSATAKAHGLIAEAMTGTGILQSIDPQAQVIEKEIKDVWKVYAERPRDHVGSPVLLDRLAGIAREIGTLAVPYAEWQIVYRQALQLSQALHGHGQLLEKHSSKEDPMTSTNSSGVESGRASAASESLRHISLRDLVSAITDDVKLLATRQFELARTEIQSDIRSEVAMGRSLAIAAICGILGLSMLLVAGVFALAMVMPGWAAALLVAAPLIVLGAVLGAIGWNKRVRTPLEETRASLKEGFEWTKNRLA